MLGLATPTTKDEAQLIKTIAIYNEVYFWYASWILDTSILALCLISPMDVVYCDSDGNANGCDDSTDQPEGEISLIPVAQQRCCGSHGE